MDRKLSKSSEAVVIEMRNLIVDFLDHIFIRHFVVMAFVVKWSAAAVLLSLADIVKNSIRFLA